MKKIISLIIAVLLLVSCFSFTAFGEALPIMEEEIVYADLPTDAKITFSEDFKILHCGEQSYTRCNTEAVMTDIYFSVKNKVVYEKESVNNISLTANKKGNLISAEISYIDGALLTVSYISDKYLEEYESILKNEKKEYVIDFYDPDDNVIKVNREKLMGKEVKLKVKEFYYAAESFNVNVGVSDGSIEIIKGEIHILSDKIYYVDFDENNYGDYYENDNQQFILHEIEDIALIEEIKSSQEKYYDAMEFGIFMDDEISERVAKVFFIIFFIVLPFAILVLSLIFGFRSNKIYKKMFFVISALSAVEAMIFIIVSTILFK